MNDVDCTKCSKMYGFFSLELCTDLARFMKTTGKKATKVGGWLQSLSYAKLDLHKLIKTPAYIELYSR